MEERYKLYNGDCLEVMDRLIEEGVVVDAIITDIPYGTTACSWDSVIPFEEMWKRIFEIRFLKDTNEKFKQAKLTGPRSISECIQLISFLCSF